MFVGLKAGMSSLNSLEDRRIHSREAHSARKGLLRDVFTA